MSLDLSDLNKLANDILSHNDSENSIIACYNINKVTKEKQIYHKSPNITHQSEINHNMSDTENPNFLETECNTYTLRNIRLNNLDKLIVGHLNVNSIRYKFDALKSLIKDNIDILVVSETKIDKSFPHSQFCIDGYNIPFRLDRSHNGGGILVYF